MDKYEEALERARQGLPMDEVFPELKESEDEKFRKYILQGCKECVEVNKGLELSMDTTKKLLSYLEKQKEQKPAEWSEEDERKIVELKTFIAQCNGFNKENRKKTFDMIDAIRHQPHWKPSEEQMAALKNARHMMGQSGDYYDTTAIIDSLITDLQKLL